MARNSCSMSEPMMRLISPINRLRMSDIKGVRADLRRLSFGGSARRIVRVP